MIEENIFAAAAAQLLAVLLLSAAEPAMHVIPAAHFTKAHSLWMVHQAERRAGVQMTYSTTIDIKTVLRRSYPSVG